MHRVTLARSTQDEHLDLGIAIGQKTSVTGLLGERIAAQLLLKEKTAKQGDEFKILAAPTLEQSSYVL